MEMHLTLRLREIVIDCADHGAVVDFWAAALGDYERHDVNEQYVALVPAEQAPAGRRSCSRRSRSPRSVKNRVHLDFRGESMAGEVERLLAWVPRSSPSAPWATLAGP